MLFAVVCLFAFTHLSRELGFVMPEEDPITLLASLKVLRDSERLEVIGRKLWVIFFKSELLDYQDTGA